MDAGRRRILQAGLAGAALLVALRWRPAHGKTLVPIGRPLLHLRPDEFGVLLRVVPVMLDGALPAAAAERQSAIDEVLRAIDATLEHEPPSVREEIHELFGVLTFGATRALLAGIWTSWQDATDADIHRFLANWKDSRFALLRSAYIGLNNLVMGAWYANPRSWPRIGYPGPPRLS